MIYNGIQYFQGMYDKYRYATPKLSVGQTIKILFDDETLPLPGSSRMKKGVYTVLRIDKACVGEGLVYHLKKVGKNIKTDWGIYTIPIDKAIEAKVIEIL